MQQSPLPRGFNSRTIVDFHGHDMLQYFNDFCETLAVALGAFYLVNSYLMQSAAAIRCSARAFYMRQWALPCSTSCSSVARQRSADPSCRYESIGAAAPQVAGRVYVRVFVADSIYQMAYPRDVQNVNFPCNLGTLNSCGVHVVLHPGRCTVEVCSPARLWRSSTPISRIIAAKLHVHSGRKWEKNNELRSGV